MSAIFECPLCTDFRATDFQLLLPHIRLVHSTRPGFSLQCSIENCSRFFTNLKTYTNHIYSEHMCLPSAYRCNAGKANATTSVASGASSTEMDFDEGNGGEECQVENNFPCDFMSTMACWILRIKECCKLTQSTMDEVIQRVTDLNKYILSQVSLAVNKVISDAGLDIDSVPQLKDIFDPNGEFGRPFRGVETSYQLLKHCKESFGFVVSAHRHRTVLVSVIVCIMSSYRNLNQSYWVQQTDGKGTVEKGATTHK